MQTVPSLVGTGAAIAAAASGLVFGQPTEPDLASAYTTSSTSRRRTHKRHRSNTDYDHLFNPRFTRSASPRPATSAAVAATADEEAPYYTTLPRPPSSSRPPPSRYQRPLSSHFTPPMASSPTSSYAKQGEPSTPVIPEVAKDSDSTHGSWIRRLSLRPLSYHESSRSSAGPDSPSITFSHGSSAPILSPTGSAPLQLPPNKLVKRAPSAYHHDANPVPRRRTKSHLPSFRRPATSHQRSATLQQFQPPSDVASQASPRDFSFDRDSRPRSVLVLSPSPAESAPASTVPATKPAWVSFFHSRTASLSGRSGHGRLSELSPVSRTPSKRIRLSVRENRWVHLLKPRMVSAASAPPVMSVQPDIKEEPDQPTDLEPEPEATPEAGMERQGTPEETTPPRKSKRSFSISISSASNWMSKTSGSIRRPKRGDDPKDGNKRHASDPINGFQPAVGLGANTPLELDMPQERQGSALDSAGNAHLRTRKRNCSSPLPPLSRLSSFNVDMSRLGSPSGHHVRPNQPSGSSTSSAAMSQLRTNRHERSSTLESSEGDTREFTSGDDDDTDFKSDTMFDSIRTVASGRNRAVETPLDSLYDESPPSTAGNGRTKRLSIQEILGKSWDEENRIMEEDENAATPVRNVPRIDTRSASHEMSSSPRFSSDYSPQDISPTTKDFSRMSFDDDFDDDWARDDVDEALYNPLSPPSKGSSLNSRGNNRNVRLALANIGGDGFLVVPPVQTPSERPMSNIFDWSEPTVHDKSETDGRSPRPSTAGAKQELDSRGGRLAVRKTPAPLHVRSQSVPVVHDLIDQMKPIGAKYGTWGLGTKTASEDWDDDFEFGGGNLDSEERNSTKVFAVPESIRATQPSVKAHSGQIRELSLLVNDLKRLCRHGREMDIMNGSSRGLWKEAEGIIALASPDDDSDSDDQKSNASTDLDIFQFDQPRHDGAFDVGSFDRFDAAFDVHEPAMSKTAVVRERHSPRRRSVFSPEDDIFGNFSLGSGESSDQSPRPSRPRTPEIRPPKPNDVSGVVRSVMEAMQHRTISEPVLSHSYKDGKMHFDTNSLKALVKRAGDLRDALADLIRRADQITSSPIRAPRHERETGSSPAFTRVFDDPGSSPPRRLVKNRGNTSLVDTTSPDRSPSGLPQRMQMMTVN